jgi:hypothetical protein
MSPPGEAQSLATHTLFSDRWSFRSSLTLSSSRGRGSFQIAAVTHDQEGGLEAIIDLKFVKDIGKVRFYGFFTYKNLFADLLVCQPLGH